jgi:hypothetical protein
MNKLTEHKTEIKISGHSHYYMKVLICDAIKNENFETEWYHTHNDITTRRFSKIHTTKDGEYKNTIDVIWEDK